MCGLRERWRLQGEVERKPHQTANVQSTRGTGRMEKNRGLEGIEGVQSKPQGG